ncbi:MAG: MBL fold metallo-hydrolase [Candidatus Moranbacteria bacterium]|nr:MBL fold metallo-hydrolase [Candidatus Moranbacteria bacterium]MDD3965408.1 MBL fold metallo-hydrolase [Candidatus Moranbacteria bacterium]
MSKKILLSSLVLLFFIACILYAGRTWWDGYREETFVTFLSVGEGDALLISQGSNQVVIDGGRKSKDLLARLGRYLPFWDRTIEVVIATHPDADHVGGFPGLFSTYHINHFLSTGAESETEVFTLLKQSLEKYHIDTLKVSRGTTLQLPIDGLLSIEYPETTLPETMAETNKGSIVARFTYGETSMLFTGDLPSEEMFLPDIGHIDILKVSHHGSRYSTSEVFLDQFTPKEAVISVGKNSYGHPSSEVLHRLKKRNIRIHRTDEEGDIQYVCTRALQKCILP